MATDLAMQTLAVMECAVPAEHTAAVNANIAIWWDVYSNKSQYLKYLYLKKHIIDYLLGNVQQAIDTQIGSDNLKGNQLFTNLLRRLGLIESQLANLDPDYQVSNIATIGSITARSNQAVAQIDPYTLRGKPDGP